MSKPQMQTLQLPLRLIMLPAVAQQAAVLLAHSTGIDLDNLLDLLLKPKHGRPAGITQFQRWRNGRQRGQPAPKKRRARGRPTKRENAVFNRRGPEWVDDVKARNGLSGHGSDKKAIEILVNESCPTLSAYRKKDLIRHLQKCLSEARKE